MISRSLRKHRIIRSNILQTNTPEPSVALFASVWRRRLTCAGAGLLLAISFQVSAVADGTDSQALQSSRALLRSLRGAPPAAVDSQQPATISTTRPSVPPVPQIPTQSQPKIATAALESGPGPVPPIPLVVPPAPVRPVAALLAAAERPLHSVPESQVEAFADETSDVAGKMLVNDVLLTSGQDDVNAPLTDATASGPVDMTDLQVPTLPEYDQWDLSGKAQVGTLSDHGVVVNRPNRPDRPTRVQKIFGFDGSVVRNNFKRGTSKFRHRAARVSGPFIERYDPTDYTDDYTMPVLLIAAQEEEADPLVAENGSGLLSRRLSDIKPTLDYAWGDLDESQLPDDFHERMDHGPYIERMAPRTVVQWHPTNLWYYPLYFEDPGLERYGHTRRPLVQPFFSAGRFLGQVAGLPYQATLHPTNLS